VKALGALAIAALVASGMANAAPQKVYGGQIHAVEAFMKNKPVGTASGWN
jgi:hypothetical protein